MEPESEFIIKVQDINDNEPRFLDGPYVAKVPEMSPAGKYNKNVIIDIKCEYCLNLKTHHQILLPKMNRK